MKARIFVSRVVLSSLIVLGLAVPATVRVAGAPAIQTPGFCRQPPDPTDSRTPWVARWAGWIFPSLQKYCRFVWGVTTSDKVH